MVDGGLGRAENAGKQILRDLAKKEPYYKPTKEQKSSNKPKEIKSMPLTSTQSVAAAPKMIKLDLKPPLDTEVVSIYNNYHKFYLRHSRYRYIAHSYQMTRQRMSLKVHLEMPVHQFNQLQ